MTLLCVVVKNAMTLLSEEPPPLSGWGGLSLDLEPSSRELCLHYLEEQYQAAGSFLDVNFTSLSNMACGLNISGIEILGVIRLRVGCRVRDFQFGDTWR